MEIKFSADKVKTTGPKVDGGTSVTLEVGEYERAKLKALFDIPSECILEVTINVLEKGEGVAFPTAQ